MNSWHALIDITHLGQNEWIELMQKINEALTDYSANMKDHQDTKQILEKIIALCEEYITAIPKEMRSSDSLDHLQEEPLSNWPHLMRILDIQKKAVTLASLPEAKNEAQARRIVLNAIFNSGQTSSGKRLEKEYWPEARYQDNIAIRMGP